MFAEGESELRDLVVQNLESSGFLNKIKAELRAGVFLALSEDGSLKKKVPLFNKKLDDFMNTSDGNLALSVVREFLEYFNLNFTLSVFDPEVSSSNSCISRKKLCEEFNLIESELEGPILSALFKIRGTKNLSDRNICSRKENQDKNSNNIVEKIFAGDKNKGKNTLNTSQTNTEEENDFHDDNSKATPHESNAKLDESSLISLNKMCNDRNFFKFRKTEEKDILKDTIDNFFDDPVPSEKPSFLCLNNPSLQNDEKKISSMFLHSETGDTKVPNDGKMSSTFLSSEKESICELTDKKKPSTFLTSEKRSLSSLRDLPSLTKQDSSKNKESSITSRSDSLTNAPSNIDHFKGDPTKKDIDPESNEEYSDRQINSEESIEEEIEEEFSAGLDDLLNSSLSLGDDVTSDQTISQTSVVDGIDHIEPCNSVN